MPWTTGVFSRIRSWVADQANGLHVQADLMDADANDMALAINNCLTKDGQNAASANLPMAGNRHTGVGSGTARDHYATVGQLQDGAALYAVAGGTANALTLVLSPPVTALVDGMEVAIRSQVTITGASTAKINSLPLNPIKRQDGGDTQSGDIVEGRDYALRFNATRAAWILLHQATASSEPTSVDRVPATPILDLVLTDPAGVQAGWIGRATAGTYIGSDGMLRSASVNAPRIDFDPLTGAPRGLLVEAAATNLLAGGDTLSSAGISTAAGATATRTAAAALSPAGAQDAVRLAVTSSGVSSWANLNQALSALPVATCISVYAKADAGGGRLILQTDRVGGGRWGSGFDLSVGVLGTSISTGGSTVSDRGMIDVGGGWYRCWVSGTHAALTTATYFVALAGSAGQEVFAHAGQSILLSRAQVEAGSVPTSYIPTPSAAASRSADLLTIPLTDLPGYRAEGTLYVEYDAASVSGGNQFVGRLSDASSNNQIALNIAGGHLSAVPLAAGVSGIADAGAVSAGAATAAVMAWTSAGVVAQRRGGAITAAAGPVPTAALTRLDIGHDHVGANHFSGRIRRVILWPRRLPDGLLSSLVG